MAGSTVVCEGCGSICNTEDGYCKHCWKKLPAESADNDGVLEGIGHSDWQEFIEKKTHYYMPIFQKHEGKKLFLSINLSALFLGNNWLFYRKMYKVAAVMYIVLNVLFLMFNFVIGLTYTDRLNDLQAPIDAYHKYLDEGGDKIVHTSDGQAITPTVVTKGRYAEMELVDMKLIIMWKALLCTLISQSLIMGLFGNAIYKTYIQKHIHDPNGGGASVSSLLFGWIIADILEGLLIYPLANLAMIFLT